MSPKYGLRPTFNEAKERAEQRGDEWIYGAIQTDLAAIPVAVRLRYLPDGVLQFNLVMDTNGCAARGPVNIYKSKFDYFYDNGMHPALRAWCDQEHFIGGKPYRYRVNGRFIFDETFIEILSGTTKDGNSLKAPLDTIRNVGLIPEILPLDRNMTWEQYMDRSRITDEMLELGKQFLRRFSLNYEKVSRSQFTEAWNDDPIDVALFAWPSPVNDVYPRTEGSFNHAIATFTGDIYALDNYEPFLKRLAKDYNFFEWGYSLSVTAQNPYPEETIKLFEVLQKFGLLAFFAEAWKRLVYAPIKPPQTAPPIQNDVDYPALIYTAAKNTIGLDASPTDKASDELGCAESVCTILRKVNSSFPVLLSTTTLHQTLPQFGFKQVSSPQAGDVVISPTGMGKGIGHCGIVGRNISQNGTLWIMSNNSSGVNKGLWTANYTVKGWQQSFGSRGFPTFFWRSA